MKRIFFVCLAHLFISGVFAAETNILVAYFSVPERAGVDAVAGASRVVSNGKVVGNTHLVAERILELTGGDRFVIETVDPYPAQHDALVKQGESEKKRNERPLLSGKIPNVDKYNVIFVGYPVWWADLPMPMYSFFDAYNFNGKTIIPFSTHGGSGFADTIATIAALEPGATVQRNGFTVSRNVVSRADSDISSWVRSLNLK